MSDSPTQAAPSSDAIEALIRRCLRGDQAAWESIVRQYRRHDNIIKRLLIHAGAFNLGLGCGKYRDAESREASREA